MSNLTHTQNGSRKYGDKDIKALCKLMNNAAYAKTMENLINTIDGSLESNKNGHQTQGIYSKKYLTMI